VTAQQIRGGLTVYPFTARAWYSIAQDEWVVEWHTTSDDYPEQAAVASFRETEGGIDWLRFYVREEFRNQGIYTQALRWSMSLGVQVTASGEGLEPEMWAGFKQADGGLKLDKRVAKARVKVG
jgi:hypothetical protein